MDLKKAQVTPTLPVTNVQRARDFYVNKLGLKEKATLKPDGEHVEVVLELANNNVLCLYERPEPSGSKATACSFEVDDVDGTVKDLQGKGVRFEEYDLPEMGIKTKNGIASMGEFKSAWFKDPDGNILAIGNGLHNLKRGVTSASMTRTA